ncbi:hypothetical protein BG011_005268 [Mortierella polycephala]|uniref:Hemimethylated DNA-binding domain-containing protein n=1 Tax=Mortierella polycephala TaxID=41804 RepID=A0A9P6PWJ0_9FUNG|nr:hypothetical protein BG011_005268 [Mortierella polycephala]
MASWVEVYRERHEKDAIVRMLLDEIIEDSRNRMRHMDGIADIGMAHARDILENVIAGRNGEQRDLSRIYYARKTLKRLQRGWVLDQWRAYRTNQQNFPIWQGCGLMTMFSDHEMELSDIDLMFQSMAQEFLAISPLPNQDELDLTGEYSYNSFDRLQDLIRFFTREKGFKGNTENYYDPFNSFIDKVLVRKVGIPISLCIVFAELAQRVGVTGVELMGLPQHFMIRYRPPVLDFSRRSSPLLGSDDSRSETPPIPPTYYLDLFHPPHQLLSTDEYEDYFSHLNIPRPPDVYRNLPTPPLEVFLRCLRNIILAVEQTGGAGRIGSDHQTSLYSGITQLLALHPSEEWGLYVLWLKYLSNFWPEDIGFVRTAIEDMNLADHRRSAARGTTLSATSSTLETIKILRAQVRELEMADEAGDVGQIRRRRRPKVTPIASSPSIALASSSAADPSAPRPSETVTEDSDDVEMAGSSSTSDPIVSSPTIDYHSFNAHHQQRRNNSIVAEQQHESHSSMFTRMGERAETEEGGDGRYPARVAMSFGDQDRRRPEPEFYVGEVFRHRRYHYMGVIYGYDLKCEADEGWIRSMGIDALTQGRNQPFYNALLRDGISRYVAEQNIQVLFREFRQPALSSSSLSSSTAEEIHSQHHGSQATIATPAPALHAEHAEPVVQHSSALQEQDPSLSSVAPPPQHSPESGVQEPLGGISAPSLETGSEIAPDAPTTTGSTPPSFQFSELGPLGIEAVGQYFEAWDGVNGHYVMNKELRKLYPTEDYQ